MRPTIPTPCTEPLPYTRNGNHVLPMASPLVPLRSEAIASFDALLHELNPDAVRVDPDRLQNLLGWLVSLPPPDAEVALERRLGRIEQLRAMLDDGSWDTPEATRMRLLKLFEYVDRGDDLIHDREPVVGLLDDVLLIELAWPTFAVEAAEYADFCAYRNDHHPVGSGKEQRRAWVRDRLAEIAMLRQHSRIDESHYAASGKPDYFRVG